MDSSTADRALPVWRSLLYVPVNVPRFVDKAHTRGADAVQLDLEDSVPQAEKEAARALVRDAARRVRVGGADVVVRINRSMGAAIRDLEAAVCPDVDAIALTKVASASHVRLLDEYVSELERRSSMPVGRTRFIAMVETAQAFFAVERIAASSPRIAALALGTEDFAFSVGMEPEPEGLFYPKLHTAFAARAAGVIPLGFIGTAAGFEDKTGFRAMVRRSRSLGFEGASCIHPDQVAILNEEFAPTAAELEAARRLVAANDEAERLGRGAFALDGKMVDVPVVLRARRVLARDAAIRARLSRRPVDQPFRPSTHSIASP